MTRRTKDNLHINSHVFTNRNIYFKEDKLLIKTKDGSNWLDQPKRPVEVQLLESTGRSYSEQKLIEKVKEMYELVNGVAFANNETDWFYQRLVDAALTQLKYDQHMLIMVGDAFDQSWPKIPLNEIPTNNRENYEASEVERTNFRVNKNVDIQFIRDFKFYTVNIYSTTGYGSIATVL